MARRDLLRDPERAGDETSRSRGVRRRPGPASLSARCKDKVERCAAFLKSIGIERGDVVTIQLPNRIAFPIVFFSLELIGAIANKVNPDFRLRELDYILRFSGSRALICSSSFKGFEYVAMARRCARQSPA